MVLMWCMRLFFAAVFCFRLAVASPLSGEQTYVSQEVCTSVLHECKGAIKRATMVSLTSICIIQYNNYCECLIVFTLFLLSF